MQPQPDPRLRRLSYVLFIGAGLGVVFVSFTVQTGGWFVEQVMLIMGLQMPAYAWPLISWGQGLWLAIPVVPLALAARSPRTRAVYRTWTLAIGFLLVLAFARFFPLTSTQPAALAQIVLTLLGAAALAALAHRRDRLYLGPPPGLVLSLCLAGVIVYPWLAFGALGSPLDTILNLLAGLSFGLLAGLLLSTSLLAPLAAHATRPGEGIFFAGFAASVTLAILGAGFGFGGSQLLLLICLPPLGLALAALSHHSGPGEEGPRRAWVSLAVLVGLATAAPLTFVDPDELTLLLLGTDLLGEILGWALLSAALSLLLGAVAGLVLWRVPRVRTPASPTPSLGALILIWVGAGLAYVLIGQPGFYGEQLFVILRDQADLSPAAAITDRDERVLYVYTSLTQQADRGQSRLRGALDLLRADYRPYYLVNSLEVNGGPILRAYLARQPEVDRVLDSPHLRPLPRPKAENRGGQKAPDAPPWNIRLVGADRVWEELGITGRGIVVGQSDSGVQGDHPALRDNYRGRHGQDDYNWLDPWNDTRSPTDVEGHGTHTLGTVLGRGAIGVAPEAEWFGCVNLARNLGNPPLYLDCLQFMLAPYPQGGDPFRDGDPGRAAHVTSNSWGCPSIEGCDADSLRPAVQALRAAGIFVSTSAGNEGPRCASVNDPIAIYADAFSAGAIDAEGDLAFFSSRGPVTVDGSGRVKPDLVAPGVEVLSAYPGSTYATESGTSMAGPHVAGVVALMWSAQPQLIGDVERTEEILRTTARPYTGLEPECAEGGIPNNASGYGVLDAYAAVQAALAASD